MWGVLLGGLSLILGINFSITSVSFASLNNAFNEITSNFITNSCHYSMNDVYIDKDLLKKNLKNHFQSNVNNLVKTIKIYLEYYNENKIMTFDDKPKGVTIVVTSDFVYGKFKKGITYFIEDGNDWKSNWSIK